MLRLFEVLQKSITIRMKMEYKVVKLDKLLFGKMLVLYLSHICSLCI